MLSLCQNIVHFSTRLLYFCNKIHNLSGELCNSGRSSCTESWSVIWVLIVILCSLKKIFFEVLTFNNFLFLYFALSVETEKWEYDYLVIIVRSFAILTGWFINCRKVTGVFSSYLKLFKSSRVFSYTSSSFLIITEKTGNLS